MLLRLNPKFQQAQKEKSNTKNQNIIVDGDGKIIAQVLFQHVPR